MFVRGHNDVVTGIVFAPDGRRLLSGGQDQALKIWNTAVGPARLPRGERRGSSPPA
jgi:WD40 repeat protein